MTMTMMHIKLYIFTVALYCFICLRYPAYGNDSSDEDYYEHEENYDDTLAEQPYREENTILKSKPNLTVDQIQDYLLNIHSKVFTNNEVFTVKQRKPFIKEVSKKPHIIRETHMSEEKKFTTLDGIQSDQPQISWQKATAQATVEPLRSPSYNTTKNETLTSQSFDKTTNTPIGWNCAFKQNYNCGIVNDLAVGNFFQLQNVNFLRNFEWKTWYLMLNTSKMPPRAIGARLITDYFDTKNVSKGNNLPKVIIHQQDKDNYCLWSNDLKPNVLKPDVPVNHQVDLTIDLNRSSPRFFLDLYLPGLAVRDAVFALANVRLTYKPCFNDNTNMCMPSQQSPQHHYAVSP